MPYVTTVERAGIEKGHRIGYQKGEADLLLWLIEKKFGNSGDSLLNSLRLQVSSSAEQGVRGNRGRTTVIARHRSPA